MIAWSSFFVGHVLINVHLRCWSLVNKNTYKAILRQPLVLSYQSCFLCFISVHVQDGNVEERWLMWYEGTEHAQHSATFRNKERLSKCPKRPHMSAFLYQRRGQPTPKLPAATDSTVLTFFSRATKSTILFWHRGSQPLLVAGPLPATPQQLWTPTLWPGSLVGRVLYRCKASQPQYTEAKVWSQRLPLPLHSCSSYTDLLQTVCPHRKNVKGMEKGPHGARD